MFLSLLADRSTQFPITRERTWQTTRQQRQFAISLRRHGGKRNVDVRKFRAWECRACNSRFSVVLRFGESFTRSKWIHARFGTNTCDCQRVPENRRLDTDRLESSRKGRERSMRWNAENRRSASRLLPIFAKRTHYFQSRVPPRASGAVTVSRVHGLSLLARVGRYFPLYKVDNAFRGRTVSC